MGALPPTPAWARDHLVFLQGIWRSIRPCKPQRKGIYYPDSCGWDQSWLVPEERAGRERHSRYLNKGKVQVGKRLAAAPWLCWERGGQWRELCFVSLLHCCFLWVQAARWKPTVLDFPAPGEPPSFPVPPPQLQFCSLCFSMGLCLTQPHKLLSLSGFSCRDIPGEISDPRKNTESLRVKGCRVTHKPRHQRQTLSERELLLINGKGKLIVIRYKCQSGNSAEIKHQFSTKRKGWFPWCSLSPLLNADEKNTIQISSLGDRDILAFTISGTRRVTPWCTKLTELFTFLWAGSAAGVNHCDGSDFGGILPTYSSEGFGAEMFPSV